MIEVRIRHADDTRAHHLAEVPFTQQGLASVIPLINEWGIEGDSPELSGQINYDDTGAYFEVVISNEG